MVFALIISISFAFADNLSANNYWSSDDDTLPEVLLKKMHGKSDDEIQKAVFQAFENQVKVISEYTGHTLDPETPYGYFKDEMPISNARTSDPQSDLIFYNNAIRGFIGHNKNTIIIKWIPDQVVTELGWKEMNVRGRYTFMNSSYFDQGKYHIQLQDVKYLASTTLSENTESYPSTVPKSSISYKGVKVSFTGGLPEVLKTSDSSNVKHFIEDIVFQQVADRVVRDTRNNITVAIRQVIKPFVLIKNDTNQNFPGTNGKLPSGNVGYTISNTVISGFANTVHKMKKVTAKMAANTVIVDGRTTMHNLDGKFDFKLEESKPTIGKATFTVSRIDVNISFNVLKLVECKSEIVVNQPNVKYGTKLSADIEKALTNAFFDNVKIQMNTIFCKGLDKIIKLGK
jgi:hypothetical protein